nr:Pr6Pr family membrane protein [Cryobacterium sp. BB736]
MVAATGVVALIGDINFTLGNGPFAVANFFSYFTVESMIIAICVFVIGAVIALRRDQDPLWLDMLRVLSTTWLIVSGIVFAVILVEGTLRGVPVWAPWSSQLLHFWIPAYAIVDWLVAPARDVPWRTVLWVMIFPSMWVVFTMIRGASVFWYPYFFLDPNLVDMPWEFIGYLLLVIAIFSATVAMLIGISRLPTFEELRARG